MIQLDEKIKSDRLLNMCVVIEPIDLVFETILVQLVQMMKLDQVGPIDLILIQLSQLINR